MALALLRHTVSRSSSQKIVSLRADETVLLPQRASCVPACTVPVTIDASTV